ncbi:unnamed protein product [Scytosiphon promiscuus]
MAGPRCSYSTVFPLALSLAPGFILGGPGHICLISWYPNTGILVSSVGCLVGFFLGVFLCGLLGCDGSVHYFHTRTKSSLFFRRDTEAKFLFGNEFVYPRAGIQNTRCVCSLPHLGGDGTSNSCSSLSLRNSAR